MNAPISIATTPKPSTTVINASTPVLAKLTPREVDLPAPAAFMASDLELSVTMLEPVVELPPVDAVLPADVELEDVVPEVFPEELLPGAGTVPGIAGALSFPVPLLFPPPAVGTVPGAG